MRARGEGSIYQDTDGRWRGAIVVGWVADPSRAGRQVPVRKRVSGRSARDVAGKLRALQRDLEDGRTEWARTPTLTQWLDHWLDEIAKPTVAPSTYQGYAVAVRRLKAHVGSVRLDRLRPEDLEGVYAVMRAEGHAAGNVAQHHRTIRRALTVAVQRGHLVRSPADTITLPKPRRPRPRPLTVAEASAILDAAQPGRNPVRWLFALLLGWRQGEVLGLSWDRVDLTAGTVTRDRQLIRVRGAGLQIARTKTASAESVIPLPAVMVAGLKAAKAEQRADRIRVGPGNWSWPTLRVDGSEPQEVELVFTREHGQAISREDDWSAWHTLLHHAGVAPTPLHSARHAAATWMAATGAHPRVAMELLGHSKIATTMEVYAGVSDASAREAVDRLSALLRPDAQAQ